jgi:hypothetical protein
MLKLAEARKSPRVGLAFAGWLAQQQQLGRAWPEVRRRLEL